MVGHKMASDRWYLPGDIRRFQHRARLASSQHFSTPRHLNLSENLVLCVTLSTFLTHPRQNCRIPGFGL